MLSLFEIPICIFASLTYITKAYLKSNILSMIGKSLANLQISISETVNGAKTVCHVEKSPVRNDSSVNYTCARPGPGRYVTLKVSGDDRILSLCEVQVDGGKSVRNMVRISYSMSKYDITQREKNYEVRAH